MDYVDQVKNHETRSLQQTRLSPLWSLLLGGCVCAMVGAQIYGLYSVRSFDLQKLAWTTEVASRSEVVAENDSRLEASKKEITTLATRVAAARSDADTANEEMIKAKAELTTVQAQIAEKQIALQSVREAEEAAVAASKTAVETEKAAAARLALLTSRETELKVAIATVSGVLLG